ncbi:MAG: DNA pilot protein [Microviridae sp.]|nr:MAG: DNA pilot protein [Microviridae sp.]
MPTPLGMIAAAGMNTTTGFINNLMQVGQQERLNNVNEEYNKRMTDYNFQKQMEMWEKTGYGPQVQQMKEAGLNPALMYKGSGAGGQTAVATSSQGAAQANSRPMDITGITQLALLNAQKENIEADTKLKEVNATKTAGVDTQVAQGQIKLIDALANNEVVKKEINEQILDQQFIETHIKTMTMNQVVAQAQYQTQQMWETLQQQVMQNQITKETAQDQIEIVKQSKLNLITQKLVMEMGIKVDQAQINKMAADIAQGWQGLTLEEKRMKVDGVLKQVGMANAGEGMRFRMGDVGAQSATKQIDQILNIGKEDFKK